MGKKELALEENFTFEIGGEIPERLRKNDKLDESKLKELLKDLPIKVGTLLKTDNVSFLLGAGASMEAGGVSLASIPLQVEDELLKDGIGEKRLRKWLALFYSAAEWVAEGDVQVPASRDAAIVRRENPARDPLPVNYERLLSKLYQWQAATQPGSKRLRLGGTKPEDPAELDADPDAVSSCITRLKAALLKVCNLPNPADEAAISTHAQFVKKVLTRPVNLRRAGIFTLNYDTLIEQAADAEGVTMLEGFVGSIRHVFRPESYDQDFYFPGDTTEGRVHRLDRVLHLYKLHGSLNWTSENPSWSNPYGVAQDNQAADTDRILIYPTPMKYGEVLGMPYSEMFRRFASHVVRPQSTLFVIGYSFSDDHVNAIIRQAFAIPSFTLVVIDPQVPTGGFVQTLRDQKDHRFWLISGWQLGTFRKFVESVLPDLRENEIEEKVAKTFRALNPTGEGELATGGDTDAK